jgi:hypothetical protein
MEVESAATCRERSSGVIFSCVIGHTSVCGVFSTVRLCIVPGMIG